MTHGDPVGGGGGGGRSNSRSGLNSGNGGRQTPVMDSGGEDSSANTPMSGKMGKMMSVKVLMLDDSITVFQVQVSRLVKNLLLKVSPHLPPPPISLSKHSK